MKPKSKRIMITGKHMLAGRILTRYDGTAKTIDIRGGIQITIHHGDYIARDACMSSQWLAEHPRIWQEV